jgi:hypothetical protein
MLKKISTALSLIIILIANMIVLLTPSSALAAGATLALSPSSGTANKGCTFKLSINLNTTGLQTDGTDAIIKYDPAVFSTSLAKITNGTIYPDYPGNSVDQTNGRINISGLASVNQPFSSSGTLATIEFTVKSDTTETSSQIAFDFDPNNKTKTTDSNVVERGTIQDLLDSVTDGNYTIGTGTCTQQTVPNGTGGALTTTRPLVGQGAVDTTPSGEVKQLPDSAITAPTIIIAAVGGFLVILGAIGLAIL